MAAAVPMIVMPVMWDQPFNAQFIQDIGAGVRLDWWHLKERTLSETLRSVLLSPEYRRRAASIAAELRAQEGSREVLALLEKIAASSSARDD
jgi:N-glycosyltransferase